MTLDEMEDESGGSLLLFQKDAEAAGIELRMPDGSPGYWSTFFPSDRGDYYFRGEKIDLATAKKIVEAWKKTGKQFKSVDFALDAIEPPSW